MLRCAARLPALARGLNIASACRLAAAAATAAAATATVAFAEAAAPTTGAVQKCVLSDGRHITYRVVGPDDGIPILCFHGMSSSHLTWLPKIPLSSIAPGVKMITVDRPGWGGSCDPPACYSYARFAADIAELADALELSSFAIAGHSSGGPCALAVAALLPDRVLACAAVSSDPPYNHPRCPEIVRASDDMASDQKGGFYGRDPIAKVSKWRANTLASGPDDKVWAWQQGVLGWVTDFTLERLPWSFKIEDIALGSNCTFWCGSEDYPPILLGAPWMQTLVPGSGLHIVPGGNHGFKSQPEHMGAILSQLRDQALEARSRANADVLFGHGFTKHSAAAAPAA